MSPAESTEQRAALEKVAASAAFQRAARLRELLVFLCNQALTNPSAVVSEQQIGVEVFARPRGYDCGTDTIARVHVSQLRKKLQLYYSTEGADDAIVIEVPKGSYSPVFHPRQQAPSPEIIAPSAPGWPAWPWAATAALLVCLCGWLIYQNRQLSAQLPPASVPTPALDRFWNAVAPAAKGVQIVLADANLMVISDLMGGHAVSLFEYRFRTYPRNVLDTYIADPKIRAIADHISGTHLTPAPDAQVLHQIEPLSRRYAFPLNAVHARDFRIQSAAETVILLGHKRGNPWIELFEPVMNFQYRYVSEGATYRAMLVNRKPRAGEQETYPVEYGKSGYALVAYLSNPQSDGAALLISGTDMSSVQAGGRFVTSEKSVAGLLTSIGAPPKGKLPYFEALIRTTLLDDQAPGFELIAWRLPMP